MFEYLNVNVTEKEPESVNMQVCFYNVFFFLVLLKYLDCEKHSAITAADTLQIPPLSPGNVLLSSAYTMQTSHIRVLLLLQWEPAAVDDMACKLMSLHSLEIISLLLAATRPGPTTERASRRCGEFAVSQSEQYFDLY